MTFQRCVLLLVCACVISTLVGCGGGSSPTTPPPPAISVALSTAPPASLQASQSAPVAATVTNDSANAGVDWSCAPSGACGSFSAAHTASGTATTYTAPAAVPTGGAVTITAKSTTDSTKFASGTTTITAPTVAFNPAAPASLSVKQVSPLTAVVTNDSTKKGVDWSCSPVGTCGSFSPTHTASGSATTYTAPAGAVTARIKAASTADPTQSAVANIPIFGVAISFYPQPTPSLLAGDPTLNPITAVVSHDITKNPLVDWTLSCGVSDCGTLGTNQTASSAPNTYKAPATVTADTPVTITATSHTDNSQVATAIVTATANFDNATLRGNYVFQASGVDANGPYRVVGTLVTDGAGNVTAGEQNYVFLSSTTGFTSYHDPFTKAPFLVSIGSDGRGQITLNTGDTNVGVGGLETLGIVVIDGTKALITEFDSSATSSGTLDLQTPKSQLSGGYAFVTSGINGASKPLGWGGIFDIDGPGTISGKGSITDEIDNTTVNTAQTLSGTVVSPDQYGKAVINLTAGFTAPNVGLALVGYVIDDTHVRFVEQDHFGVTGGTAFGQGTATGTLKSFSTTAAVFETEGLSTSTFVPTVYAGLFAASSGNINGVADENVSGGTPITDATLTGSYAVDSSGTGRVTTSNMEFNGVSGTGPSWVLYLTGDASTPALILQIDATPIETAGAAYTQAAGPFGLTSFNGTYGMGFTAFPSGAGEDDGTGQVSADGAGNLGSPDGTVDINYNLTTQETDTLAGTFAAPDTSGRLTGTLTTSGPAFSSSQVVFYVVDSTRVLFVDIDPAQNQPALGVFRLQEQ